jgi:glutathione synthase/RimK-type ligase-like ATP-grasp enzyme
MRLCNNDWRYIYLKETRESVMFVAMYKVKGKMIKHIALMKKPELRPYLPETEWFTESKAVQMLQTYPSIFIKPNGGSGGGGIIRVRKTADGYEIAKGKYRKNVDYESLVKALQSLDRSSNRYIVQRGLTLAKYKGKLFDLRMYLQKPAGAWIISGMVARVAAPHHFVTNHTQGGHASTLKKVLLPVYAGDKKIVRKQLRLIRKLSLRIAGTLVKRFPDIRELGIDLGIAADGHVWFIEANSRPAHRLFTQLSDKTMLNRIRKYKRLIAKKR